MKSTDFYFLFSKNNKTYSLPGIKSRGETRFGYWFLDIRGTSETSLNGIIYKTGIASDREKPQYEIKIYSEKIEISAEKFGISPIFYSTVNDELHVSSSIRILADKLKLRNFSHVNKRFLLEQCLFNFSLFDNTIFKEVKWLPSNSRIVFTDKLYIEEVYRIEDFFTDNPVSYKKCANDLVDLFIVRNSGKIKDGDYISFTSGFDGRTLLALALSKDKNIHSFSFGASDNIDLSLPGQQAEKIGLDFFPINLDSVTYINEFLNIGKNAIEQAAGNTNFLQLHWHYAAELLSEKTDTIVTGMFGSELFRAPHIAGQMISPAAIDYFKNIKDDIWIDHLKKSEALYFLDSDRYSDEFDSLIEDLETYRRKILHLSENQRLYKYLFDETFRKFFGMQIILPMQAFVNVVNPYLDWEFVKELLKTDLAGVNNDFFTENPVKRFKGQLFYAELLRKTSSRLYTMPTGKGYTPKDLIQITGKLRIAIAFIIKRMHRRVFLPDLDNLRIISGIEHCSKELTAKDSQAGLYNKSFIQRIMDTGRWKRNEMLRDKFIETISTIYYLKNLK